MSLRSRALVAVLLTIGFYVLAIGISLLLLLVVYLEISRHRFDRIALFCLIGAGLILWSIVPRPTPFTPPGPHLRPEAQPRLFEELKATAAAAGETVPGEGYLAGDREAGGAPRGG